MQKPALDAFRALLTELYMTESVQADEVTRLLRGYSPSLMLVRHTHEGLFPVMYQHQAEQLNGRELAVYALSTNVSGHPPHFEALSGERLRGYVLDLPRFVNITPVQPKTFKLDDGQCSAVLTTEPADAELLRLSTFDFIRSTEFHAAQALARRLLAKPRPGCASA